MVLNGRRAVVVGASASIGRAVALRLVLAGADVVMAARRRERLDELVAEAGAGTAVATDVRDQASCEALMAQAASALGSVDLLCYTVGYAPFRLLADTTAADWAEAFATNVTGANQVIRAALPALAPGALIVALSSEIVGRPRSALGAYASSKAALEESLVAWRGEHPEFRFCCATIGATVPTEFGNHFDPELMMWAWQDWSVKGINQESFMDTDQLADVLVDVVGTLIDRPGIGMEQIVLRSPSRVTAGSEQMQAAAEDAGAELG